MLLAGAAFLLGPGQAWAVSAGLFEAREGARADALSWAVRCAALAVLALVAVAVLRGVHLLGSGRDRLLAAAVVAELWLAHHDLHPTMPPAALAVRPPVLSAVDTSGHGRVYVYDYALMDGAAAGRLGRESAYVVAQPPAGFDPRQLAALAVRLYPVPPVAATWGVEGSYDIDQTGLQPLPMWGLNLSLRLAEGTPAHANLLRLGAVRAVIALDPRGFADLTPGPSLPSLFPERIRTFRVPGALPRARIVGKARALEGREALASLFDPAFDASAEVILSGAEARARLPGLCGAPRAASGLPSSVPIACAWRRELDHPGLVVLADAWDPGWRAWVDGRPTEVLQANVAFRAVRCHRRLARGRAALSPASRTGRPRAHGDLGARAGGAAAWPRLRRAARAPTGSL